MENLYNVNGLVFWDEDSIRLREMFEQHFVSGIKAALKRQNRAFDFFKCEASLLTPKSLINKNYTNEDVWMQEDLDESMRFNKWIRDLEAIQSSKKELEKIKSDAFSSVMLCHNCIVEAIDIDAKTYLEAKNAFDVLFPVEILVLRPETTMGSYAYAKHLFDSHEKKIKPPIVVYQHGKSFRREQDQVTKNMRLKEFYQLEFQIIYSTSTKNDYAPDLLPAVKSAIAELLGPCRMEDSDRLPDYAEWTKDVICEKTNMEVCSMSKRNDFEGMHVLEVAIGTDRCIYNFKNKNT